MESKKFKEINLAMLAGAVLRRIWIVVLAAFVMAAGFYIYTKNFVTPMYKTYVSFCVNNGSTNQSVTASDLATSQRLVLTYVEGLRSSTVLDAVSKELGGSISAGAIGGMMSADTGSETEIFRVYISHKDPVLAAKVANAIAEVAPRQIAKFIKGSSAEVVDWAKIPTAPYGPSASKNAITGGLLGAVLAAAVLCLIEVLDVRIKGEEDLAIISSAPVLGVIPDLMTEGTKNYSYTGSNAEEVGK